MTPMIQTLTPFDELSAILDKLEAIALPGYHRTYYTTQALKAISAFESYGLFKYLVCAPRYHKLIKRAKNLTTGGS